MGVFFPPDILGDRWWPQTAKLEGDKLSKTFLYATHGKNATSTQILEVSLLGAVGAVLRLERDAWSMVE